MPAGKTHDKINLLLLPPFAYMTWDFSNDLMVIILFTLSYLFSSFMFSGDLDLVSNQSKRWGLIRWIWIPYRKMFKHRSKFTHGILLGTIVRIIYISLIMGLFYTLAYFISLKYEPSINSEIIDKSHKFFNFLSKQQKSYFIYTFLGLVAGAFAHTMADEFFSTIKKMFKSKKNIKKRKPSKSKS